MTRSKIPSAASSPPPVRYPFMPAMSPIRGQLWKRRDHFNKSYRPRLFVLDGPLLHYYYSADDPAPAKSIYLSGCVVAEEGQILVEGRAMVGFKVSHAATVKAYHLACPDAEDAADWVQALKEAADAGWAQGDDVGSAAEDAAVPGPSSEQQEEASETEGALGPPSVCAAEVNGACDLRDDGAAAGPRFAGVPAEYQSVVESAFSDVLRMTSEPLPASEASNASSTTSADWKFLFSKKGVVAATKANGKLLVVRGDAVMPYPPMAVFSAVANIRNKALYDNQFDYGDRLVTYNPYTFVDYYRYKAVWPTSTRDLSNIVSWKCEDGKLMAIMKEFKDDKVCPKIRGFVRAECIIGAWLIEEVVLEGGKRGSKVKILVCSDLKGSLPSNVVSMVTQQQAMFPVIVGRWMSENVPFDDPRFDKPLTEKNIIESVINRMPEDMQVGAKPPPSTPSPAQPPTTNTKSKGGSRVQNRDLSLGVNIPTSPAKSQGKPSIFFISVALFFPVILWYCVKFHFTHLAHYRGFLFLAGLVLGLRAFCVRRLGQPMSYKDGSSINLCGVGNGGTGAVKCKFVVDLKKILRYIQTRQGGKRQSRPVSDSVAVTHIALKALAVTLSEMKLFNGRKVKLPLLGVEGYYPNSGVDVSTSAGKPENGSSSIFKLVDADSMSVGSIASTISALSSEKKKATGGHTTLIPTLFRKPLEVLSEQLDLPVKVLGLEGRKFGSALVITSPNSDGNEIDIQVDPVVPLSGKGSGPNIILVVGGVQIQPSLAKDSRIAVSRPVLGISVTFNCDVANVASCRMFSERLQQLMGNPALLK